MTRENRKLIRKFAIAIPLVALGFYFIPVVTAIFIAFGLIDVLRNDRKNALLFSRYFLGNGIFTWVLSPFNLLVDLFCYRNRKVYALEDFPPAYRAEIDLILDTFRAKKTEIIEDIDANFGSGRRGMYVYRWYGKRRIRNVPEFERDFHYVKTIAVSVFRSRESTSYHFGPLRLSLRILYNLLPVHSDQVFVECGDAKNFWHEKPLFIFDDTLLHRSVNEYDGRRYCVFMDVIRPSPFPQLISGLLAVVSVSVERVNALFYKNWKMIGSNRNTAPGSKRSTAG